MNRKAGIMAGIFLAAASAFAFYFIGFPLLSQNDQTGNPFSNLAENPASVSSIQSDIDSCVSNPTSDCDQEMQQIPKFCEQNKDQNISFCSDTLVRMYLDQRGFTRPTINEGK